MQRHRYDCEIWQLADLLKDMMLFEETIEHGSDLDKHIRVFIDDLIECLVTVNEKVGDLSLIHISEPTRPY